MCEFIYSLKKHWDDSLTNSCYKVFVTCSLSMQATMDSLREMTLFITIIIYFRFETVSEVLSVRIQCQ